MIQIDKTIKKSSINLNQLRFNSIDDDTLKSLLSTEKNMTKLTDINLTTFIKKYSLIGWKSISNSVFEIAIVLDHNPNCIEYITPRIRLINDTIYLGQDRNIGYPKLNLCHECKNYDQNIDFDDLCTNCKQITINSYHHSFDNTTDYEYNIYRQMFVYKTVPICNINKDEINLIDSHYNTL